jgi:hypothetical protein
MPLNAGGLAFLALQRHRPYGTSTMNPRPVPALGFNKHGAGYR